MSEAVVGEIPVTARLAMGSERLSLFLTGQRIIVARIGKRVGSAAAFPLLSPVTSGLEALFKGRREFFRKRKAKSLTPDLILAADKDNFSLTYDEIVSAELIESPRRTGITIVTRNDKLFFMTPLQFEKVAALLAERLGQRLTVKRFSM